MDKRAFIIVVGVIAVAAGWALFRPELLFVNQSVNESFPASVTSASAITTSSKAVLTGKFHGVAHETIGVASVHELAGGKRVLRLSGFKTSNGPDLRVLLVAAADALDNDTVKNGMPVELGSLKGNLGDQNYDVPADLDLNKYKAVTIWCNRFSVNFGTAALMGSDTRS